MDDVDMAMAMEPLGTASIRSQIKLRQLLVLNALMAAARELTLASQLLELQRDVDNARLAAMRADSLLEWTTQLVTPC